MAHSSETRRQTWTLLDQLGNWDHVKLDLNGDNSFGGANEYDDDRTHNVVNELTARDTDDNGTDNYTLVYDAVGNLTDDNEDYEYEYDVWGRLVQINPTGTANVVAKFEYNGLHHRTLAHHDTDLDGDVDASDTKLWLVHNERWQLLAAYEGTESTPREEWVYHNAGASGRGSSSYIDAVIKRWWDSDNNGSLDDESYFCQNWRHDVAVLVTDTGKHLEWIKPSSYGIPIGLPAGDTNSDGDWDSADDTNIQNALNYDPRYDPELDGDMDSSDITHASAITGSYQTLGWNVLSSTGVANFKGYAGYEWDRSAPELYHVRFRALNNKLGRWTRRDPLEYVADASLYPYVSSNALRGIDPTGLLTQDQPGFWPPVQNDHDRLLCEQARRLGLDLGDGGGVICFQGRKITCSWLLPNGPLPPRRGGEAFCQHVMTWCMHRHERDHFDDVDCAACPNPNVICRPPWNARRPTRQHQDWEECHATDIEMWCLVALRDHCGKFEGPDRATCEQCLDDRIAIVCAYLQRFCTNREPPEYWRYRHLCPL